MAGAGKIEYMCRYCGLKTTRGVVMGRPMPGNCPKKGKTRDGKTKCIFIGAVHKCIPDKLSHYAPPSCFLIFISVY